MKKFLCCCGAAKEDESNMEVKEIPGLPYHIPPMVDLMTHEASVRKGSVVLDFSKVSDVDVRKMVNNIQSDDEKEKALISEKPKAEVINQASSLPENASREHSIIERKPSEYWDIAAEESNSERARYIVSNQNGDAFYSGSPQSFAKGDAKYEGRVSHKAVVERINNKIYNDKYGLTNGLFKIIDNEWKDEIGKVGYIGLGNVTEETDDEKIEHYFIFQQTKIPLTCGDYTGKGYDEFDLAVHFEDDIYKHLNIRVSKAEIQTALRNLDAQGISLDDLYNAKNGVHLILPEAAEQNEDFSEHKGSSEVEVSAEGPQSPRAESIGSPRRAQSPGAESIGSPRRAPPSRI